MIPLSLTETLALLRQRYPHALICTACGALLATLASSHQLMEAQRLAYVCAECRYEAAQAGRVRALRVAQAAVAREAATQTRRARADRVIETRPSPISDRLDRLPESVLEPHPADPHKHWPCGGGFLSPEDMTEDSRRPEDQGHHGRKGGRPRKHPSGREARTSAQRAYRARARSNALPA